MYTLTENEWKALPHLATCAVEAIPDLTGESKTLTKQADAIRAVSGILTMLSGDKPAFMEGELRAVLQPLMQIAREELEDSVCDHSVGICHCQLGRAVEITEHIFWHLDGNQHGHCEKCGAHVEGVEDFALCWHCADAEKYPQG